MKSKARKKKEESLCPCIIGNWILYYTRKRTCRKWRRTKPDTDE